MVQTTYDPIKYQNQDLGGLKGLGEINVLTKSLFRYIK
jgi:hypothetical protein